MFFLKSIFRLREKAQIEPNEEGEMSFLDHLEDLRRTIIKMAITLIVSMLLCFSFAPKLMQILRGPVDKVWQTHEGEHLPSAVEVDDWVTAKSLANVLPALPETVRQQLRKEYSEKVLSLIDLVPILKASELLPSGKRENFIRDSLAGDTEKQELAITLHEEGAKLRDEKSGESLQLMGSFHPAETFMLSISLAFFGGIIVSFPLLMYFLLQFIVPGLHGHEKRLLYKSVAWGFGLFLGGCAFAYFLVLPRVLSFFYSYSLSMGIGNDWRIGYYISFTLKLVCVFGAVFELPVLVIPFVKLGVLSYDFMKRTRSYALIVCFVIALILAPAPDPGTMIIMAMPMYALYELCILYAWYDKRNRLRKQGEELAEADLNEDSDTENKEKA